MTASFCSVWGKEFSVWCEDSSLPAMKNSAHKKGTWKKIKGHHLKVDKENGMEKCYIMKNELPLSHFAYCIIFSHSSIFLAIMLSN